MESIVISEDGRDWMLPYSRVWYDKERKRKGRSIVVAGSLCLLEMSDLLTKCIAIIGFFPLGLFINTILLWHKCPGAERHILGQMTTRPKGLRDTRMKLPIILKDMLLRIAEQNAITFTLNPHSWLATILVILYLSIVNSISLMVDDAPRGLDLRLLNLCQASWKILNSIFRTDVIKSKIKLKIPQMYMTPRKPLHALAPQMSQLILMIMIRITICRHDPLQWDDVL
ncbi:hypothetical protein J3Q64DRAFT_1826412 [Phycomyces blakesleeanus]|uniref:Uncharacterized protein n=1 Tax=Phycomyces blakesleeanus TaxID=4837 RepID=A0ABR3AIJ4_PHYBL